MALVQKSFEKGPAGQPYVATDDGALLRTVTANGPITYETAAKAHGLYGLRFARTAASCLVRYAVPSTMVLSGSVVFSSNGVGVQVHNVTTEADVVVFKIEYRPDTGYIAAISASGTVYPLSNSAATSTLGTKFRVAYNFTISPTTATAGIINARLYNSSDTQIGVAVATTTANLGTTPVTKLQIGNTSATAAATIVDIDDLQWNDGVATFLGPMSDPTAPEVTRPAVAILGDSKADQSGTGPTAIPAAFARQGWQTSQITVSGVSSRVPWSGTVTPTTETTWTTWRNAGYDPKYVVLILGGNIRTSSQSTWEFQFNQLFNMIDDGSRQIFCMNLAYQNTTEGVAFNNWYKTFIDANPRAHLIDQYAMIRAREAAGQTVTWNADAVHMNPGTTGYDLINNLAVSEVLDYINVSDGNPAPVLTSMGTRSAIAGETISATAPITSGTATSWAWRQISGPGVTLSGSGNTRAFTAPSQASASTIVLGATATNSAGVPSNESILTVDVAAANAFTDANVFGRFLFEGGTDGQALTLANSGATPLAVSTGNTAVFSAAAKAHGAYGARWEKIAGGNTAGAISRYPFPTATRNIQFDGIITATTAPTTGKGYMNIRSGDVRQLQLNRDTNLGYYLIDRANVTAVLLANTSILTNKQYRVVIWATAGTTSTNGVYSAKIYDFATGDLLGQRVVTNADLGTAAFDTADFGAINDVDGVAMWDTLRFGSAAAELPPYVFTASAPTINAISSKTVESLVATSATATSSSTISTWTWRQISGPTVNLAGSGATRSFIAPANASGTTVVLGVTATNVDGTSAEQTATFTVLPHLRWALINDQWVATTTSFL